MVIKMSQAVVFITESLPLSSMRSGDLDRMRLTKATRYV